MLTPEGSALPLANAIQLLVLEQYHQGRYYICQRFITDCLQFLLSIGEQNHYNVNLEDEVVRRSIITHNGQVMWPAPAPQAPPPAAAPHAAPVKSVCPSWVVAASLMPLT